MDLYSRKIISWVLSTTLESKWIVQAINKAKAQRGVTNPIIIHSDRGIQYTCEAYRAATNDMIRREWINRYKILDYKHAKKLVFEYIETFYNTVRIHSYCGYLSPNKYEDKYYSKNAKNASQFITIDNRNLSKFNLYFFLR